MPPTVPIAVEAVHREIMPLSIDSRKFAGPDLSAERRRRQASRAGGVHPLAPFEPATAPASERVSERPGAGPWYRQDQASQPRPLGAQPSNATDPL